MIAALVWLAGMTLWTALVFALARLADRLLERHVSARARMALYLAVPARLLLPLAWTGGIAVSGVTSVMTTTAASVARAVTPAAAGGASGAPATDWTFVAVASAYLAGVAALLVARVASARSMGRGLRPARASLRARVPVYESDDAGPAVVGFFRPRIVIPSRIADALEPPAIAWIVRHEEAHVAAFDPLLLAAAQVTAIALWPVVPLWFALRRVRALMEIACDERALAGSEVEERRLYVKTLMDVASALRRVRPALGFGNGAAARIKAIGETKRLWPRRAGAVAVALTAAGLVACASARIPAAPAAEFVVVEIQAVDDSSVDDPDHVFITAGCHMVTQRVCSSAAASSFTVSGGVQAIAKRDGRIVVIGDDVDVAPGTNVIWAPTVIAKDGEWASVSLQGEAQMDGQVVRSGWEAKSTVRPAAGAGFELEYWFEEKRDGVVVSEIQATKVVLAEGQAVVLRTMRP